MAPRPDAHPSHTLAGNRGITYNIINDKKTIQIGWGFYKIQQVGNEYQVMACDLMNDPFQTVTEDLSLSLEIFSKQRKVLSITKAQPTDTLIVHRAAVKAPRVYLQRNEPGNQSDSGWYMGAIGVKAVNDPSEYARIYTYQLLNFCKEALSVMHLPTGTICIIKNGSLVEIVDKDNNKIF